MKLEQKHEHLENI